MTLTLPPLSFPFPTLNFEFPSLNNQLILKIEIPNVLVSIPQAHSLTPPCPLPSSMVRTVNIIIGAGSQAVCVLALTQILFYDSLLAFHTKDWISQAGKTVDSPATLERT